MRALVRDHARSGPLVDVLRERRLRDATVPGREEWTTVVVVGDVDSRRLDVVAEGLGRRLRNADLAFALRPVL